MSVKMFFKMPNFWLIFICFDKVFQNFRETLKINLGFMHLLFISYWVLQAIFSGHLESYLMHNKGPPFIDILVSSWFIILPLSYKKDGYIMSSSRGSSGETTWSICSRLTFEAQLKSNSLKCLFDASEDIDNFDGRPGSTLGPDDQCRVFLKVEWPEILRLIRRGTSMKWPEFKFRIHIIFFDNAMLYWGCILKK